MYGVSGADAQSLQKGDGNALVDYGEAVKLYVEKMAKGGKAVFAPLLSGVSIIHLMYTYT